MKNRSNKYIPFLILTVAGAFILLIEKPRMFWAILLFVSLTFCVLALIYKLFENSFFNSKAFIDNKNNISEYIKDCSDLIEHINEVKIRYADMFTFERLGCACSVEQSKYNFKRRELTDERLKNNVCNCSLSVVKKAEESPFLYLCKYFDIDKNEKTLETVEQMLNDFLSIEDGMNLVKIQRNKIFDDLHIPYPYEVFLQIGLTKNWGVPNISFSSDYFPKFIFKYVSAGGNSSRSTCITLDIENTEQLIKFLSLNIQKSKSQKYQRQLMTPKVRTEIKERDKYTCKKCGISTAKEPHLLLEIDHIIPISKGGITCKDNLQTLCWKCNRSKSNKIDL